MFFRVIVWYMPKSVGGSEEVITSQFGNVTVTLGYIDETDLIIFFSLNLRGPYFERFSQRLSQD